MKRIKWLFMFMIVALLVFPIQVGAHSYVTESSPNDGEEVEHAVEEIRLHFNAGIERVTTAIVYNEHGEEVEVDHIEVESPDLTVFLTEPLLSGEYVVEWKALGEDTHQTEGSFSFQIMNVELEEVDEEESVNEHDETIVGDDVESLDPVEEETSVVEEDEAVESSMGRFLLPFVITGVIGLVVISSFLFKRLKR